jgi:hypothetical protein
MSTLAGGPTGNHETALAFAAAAFVPKNVADVY